MNGEAAYTTLLQHYGRDADEEEQSTKKKNRSVNPFSYFFVCVETRYSAYNSTFN